PLRRGSAALRRDLDWVGHGAAAGWAADPVARPAAPHGHVGGFMGHTHHAALLAAHGHQPLGWQVFEVVAVLLLAAAAFGYAAGLITSRNRGRWPAPRTLAWYAGLLCAAAGLAGPVATA